jgi:hypothetical protein
MRSDAIDQLISSYLELPAKMSWQGAIGDSVRGIFEGGRLELAGLAVLALPFDRMVFEADRFQFTPGLPAKIEATGTRVEVSIGQRQVDRWLRRGRAPFQLRLTDEAIDFRMDLAGFPISRAQTELAIQGGWFTLKPKRAEILGLQSRFASLFRAYLPLPRLTPETRITGIRHAPGSLTFQLTLDDFEEEITMGLVQRVQARLVPFADRSALRSRPGRTESED